MQIMLVSLFGLLGVLSRFGIDKLMSIPENSFPWNTFLINMLGCALAGIFYVFAEKEMISSHLQMGLIIGFCGGFTTFSAYALQTVVLFEKTKAMPALIYFLVSPTLGLLAAFAAITAARKFIS